MWSVECGVLSVTVPYLGNPLSNRLENEGETIRKEIATNGYMTCDTTVDRYRGTEVS